MSGRKINSQLNCINYSYTYVRIIVHNCRIDDTAQNSSDRFPFWSCRQLSQLRWCLLHELVVWLCVVIEVHGRKLREIATTETPSIMTVSRRDDADITSASVHALHACCTAMHRPPRSLPSGNWTTVINSAAATSPSPPHREHLPRLTRSLTSHAFPRGLLAPPHLLDIDCMHWGWSFSHRFQTYKIIMILIFLWWTQDIGAAWFKKQNHKLWRVYVDTLSYPGCMHINISQCSGFIFRNPMCISNETKRYTKISYVLANFKSFAYLMCDLILQVACI